ncbi:MAG TPA: vWA domain-containing protein [Candidatus Obscuribacterales bacterium]
MTLEDMYIQWLNAWPKALNSWSKFVQLSPPKFCRTYMEAKEEGLTESFAMIRFHDHAVIVNLHAVAKSKLEAFAVEILAHEIGHHVLCPADLTDQARMIARMRAALPSVEDQAPFVANLYADLLINDRLQRSAELNMAGVYRTLGGDSRDDMWTLYMRIYEILWALTKGELISRSTTPVIEGDALLGARLVRSYAHEWLDGAGRFAALCLPYLLKDRGVEMRNLLQGFMDTACTASECDIPAGLTEIDPKEREGAIHPSKDPRISGLADLEGEEAEDDDEGKDRKAANKGANKGTNKGGKKGRDFTPPVSELPETPMHTSGGQGRQPFEFGQILRALGLKLSDHEIAVHYYRELATPYLVRFPERVRQEGSEPLAEGLEPWDVGSPVEDVDWLESVIVSPVIVPGVTTVQRFWGTTEGGSPDKQAVDLDLYIDCSGSMPHPQVNVSYLTLAGAIIALSALRANSRVKVTLWSGAGQFETTNGFVRDEKAILRILTAYIGGGTAFPIHILRETFERRQATDPPAHIMVISDDGCDTMFSRDEKGNSGWQVAETALKKGRAGGSLVLNLARDWKDYKPFLKASEQGWMIFRVQNWEDLVKFARDFSQANYGVNEVQSVK